MLLSGLTSWSGRPHLTKPWRIKVVSFSALLRRATNWWTSYVVWEEGKSLATLYSPPYTRTTVTLFVKLSRHLQGT